MNKATTNFAYAIGAFLILWGGVSIVTPSLKNADTVEIGQENAVQRALILYNPDPYYNFDEQVCKNFAAGLKSKNISSTIISTKNFEANKGDFDLYVLCANTYNFAPDRGIQNVIKNELDLNEKNIIAITLGAGTTNRAQNILDRLVTEKGGTLLDSKSFWLLRPNDDSRSKEDNIAVANDMALQFGKATAEKLSKVKI